MLLLHLYRHHKSWNFRIHGFDLGHDKLRWMTGSTKISRAITDEGFKLVWFASIAQICRIDMDHRASLVRMLFGRALKRILCPLFVHKGRGLPGLLSEKIICALTNVWQTCVLNSSLDSGEFLMLLLFFWFNHGFFVGLKELEVEEVDWATDAVALIVDGSWERLQSVTSFIDLFIECLEQSMVNDLLRVVQYGCHLYFILFFSVSYCFDC